MKILHTSDWHLGRRLYGRTRYEEFSAFLDWLALCIERERVELLIVAGDIFDTGTPGNRAQSLYYRFLCRVARTAVCRHIVVVAGNHDSPSFLDAPRELLGVLGVHVIGEMKEATEDALLVLENNAGEPELLLCAVPYLRDRDVRRAEAGEGATDKSRKLVTGIEAYYREIVTLAEKKRAEFAMRGAEKLPIVATGHLFTTGGQTCEGDGVRELYIGTLAQVGGFPEVIDYLALGHLHIPQKVGGMEHRRYSGSPLPMGFGEAGQQKLVLLVEFEEERAVVREKPIPCFQKLLRLVGDWPQLLSAITELKETGSDAWLEIEYTGTAVADDLRQQLEGEVAGSALEIRRIKNRQTTVRLLEGLRAEETLDDVNEHQVFLRCLDTFEVPEEERAELLLSYGEIVQEFYDDDSEA